MQKFHQNDHRWQKNTPASISNRHANLLRENRYHLPERNAFTLVELLIVIMLISILLSVALVSTETSPSHSLETTARTVAADLRLARNYAIKFNSEYTVHFSLDSQSYEIEHTGSGNLPVPQDHLAGTAAASDKYIKQFQIQSMNLPDQVSLRQVQLKTSETNVSDLTFGPQGGTGPGRNEDTILILSTVRNGTTYYIPITISWITGQAWIEDIQI